MYWVCENCGETVQQDKQPDECWLCGCEMVEADECDGCGEVTFTGRLFGGYCEDCLRESINELTAERYLSERGFLVQFLCNYAWDVADISGGNERFKALCLNEFVNNYRTYHNQVEQFIMDDDGDDGKADYGKWYAKYRSQSRARREKENADG